jgi:hypothetical protein
VTAVVKFRRCFRIAEIYSFSFVFIVLFLFLIIFMLRLDKRSSITTTASPKELSRQPLYHRCAKAVLLENERGRLRALKIFKSAHELATCRLFKTWEVRKE